MLLTVGGSGSDYKTLSTGTWNAKCTDVIYPILKKYNQDPPKSTVMFVYEVDEPRQKQDGTKDKSNCMVFSKNLTMTMAPKGHLLPYLSSWLGKTPSTGDQINLEDFLGKPAKLIVTEEQKKSGNGTYAQIVKVLPSDVTFETNPDYERKDPKTYSDVVVNDDKDDKAPF